MVEKATISIGPNAKVETWRDGEWVILYVEDGSGARTTVSLGPANALALAESLHVHGPRTADAAARLRSLATQADDDPNHDAPAR